MSYFELQNQVIYAREIALKLDRNNSELKNAIADIYEENRRLEQIIVNQDKEIKRIEIENNILKSLIYAQYQTIKNLGGVSSYAA